MPLFHVKETRQYTAEYLVDAENENDARSLRGEIISDDVDGGSCGYKILSVTEVEEGFQL